MEPNGWTVVGLPTNFYAEPAEQVRSGVLLGLPAEVRFEPAGTWWEYGDGAAVSASTGGSAWSSLRLEEFSSTDTSHVYRSVGTYSVALTTVYRAEYRFAGSAWTPVEGVVSVASPPVSMVVETADTVLVAQDCSTARGAPGC